MRKELITDLLDALAVLLAAGGTAGAVFPVMGWWSLVLAGIIIVACTSLAERAHARDDHDGE